MIHKMSKSSTHRTTSITVDNNGFYSWTCYNRSHYDVVNSPETTESGIGKRFSFQERRLSRVPNEACLYPQVRESVHLAIRFFQLPPVQNQ